jgi:hypothetical protein
MTRPVILTLLSLLLATPARAAVGRLLSISDVAAASERAVVGEVIARASAWDEAGRRIVTRVTVRVDETLRGPHAPELTFTVLGGEVGELMQIVPGEANPRVGERVVLFLARLGAQGPLRVVGMNQGLLVDDGEGQLRRDFRGLSVPLAGRHVHPVPEVLRLEDLRRLLPPSAPATPTDTGDDPS